MEYILFSLLFHSKLLEYRLELLLLAVYPFHHIPLKLSKRLQALPPYLFLEIDKAKRKARAEAKRQCLAERKAAETVYKKAIREAEAVFKKEMAEARKNKDEAAKKAATEKLREAKVTAKKAWGASKEATKALCRQGEATNLSSFFGSWLSF